MEHDPPSPEERRPEPPVTPPPPGPAGAPTPPGTAAGAPTPPGTAAGAPAAPGTAAGGEPGAGPGATAWYSGPLPIAALAPRESVGAAIGRTAVKAITALVILGIGLVAIPFLLFLVLAGLAGAGSGLADPPPVRTLVAGDADADVRLVAVPVTGLILGEDRGAGGLFAPTDLTYGYTIKEELQALADDDTVDGVVLEIDTPGGTIFGSKAIAEGVERYRELTDKPIVAHVSGISASGGVYAMSGADAIYADHGTLIGSIGVIFGPFTTYDQVTAIEGGLLGGGVTTEGGIEVEFLTAGRSKDLGNPYRPMTDEERAVLQRGLDDAYADFVDQVSKGRDLAVSTITDDLGALLFGEHQALANGLIDGIANRDEAYRLAAEAAGLGGDQTWKVERLDTGTPGLLDLFAGRLAGAPEPADERARLEPLCLGSGTILAYHGDPLALCRPGPAD